MARVELTDADLSGRRPLLLTDFVVGVIWKSELLS